MLPTKNYFSSHRYSKIAIILCVISIIWTLCIERAIYYDYMSSTGKTQALFGLTLLFSYSYRYYLVFFGIIALGFSIMAIRKKENEQHIVISILLAINSIILPFLNVWQYFI